MAKKYKIAETAKMLNLMILGIVKGVIFGYNKDVDKIMIKY